MTLAALFTLTSLSLVLPPGLLDSLCFVESHYDLAAVTPLDGGEDSIGVCQVKESTARWLGFRGTREELFNPEVNVYYAGKYLKYQLTRYSGDTVRALSGYNRGHSTSPYHNNYTRKVFATWRQRGFESNQGRLVNTRGRN